MGARHYVTRFVGLHPIADKNFDYLRCTRHDRHKESLAVSSALQARFAGENRCPACESPMEFFCSSVRKVRFASENLPFQNTAGDASSGNAIEVRNTQYPELIKWMPGYLVKKNITQRNPVLVVRDIHGGGDIVVEFVSYNQKTQAMAGIQLNSAWMDEQPPADFLEEQFPRLLAADGDMLITLTAADRVSYLYDKVYEQARVYHRTPTIASVYSMPLYEKTTSKKSIAVFQAATDDNPTLSLEVVNRLFADMDDEDAISIRRYGVFKAVSGRVFKTFTPMIHVIEEEKHFPDGIPAGNWVHARMIDWHDRVPWAFVWAALSPRDEMFIVRDGNFDPDRYITEEIARQIAILSGERIRFKMDRIDPLAVKKQPNTGKSSADDLNEAFGRFRREGVKLDNGHVIHPTGANWEAWDTKSERGRDAVKARLKNSLTCKRPFNNVVTEEGQSRHLPTLWVLDCCVHTAKSLKNWRRDEWADAAAAVSKDPRETLQQKWSHHSMCLEAILKEVYFKARKDTIDTFTDRRDRPSYFSRSA